MNKLKEYYKIYDEWEKSSEHDILIKRVEDIIGKLKNDNDSKTYVSLYNNLLNAIRIEENINNLDIEKVCSLSKKIVNNCRAYINIEDPSTSVDNPESEKILYEIEEFYYYFYGLNIISSYIMNRLDYLKGRINNKGDYNKLSIEVSNVIEKLKNIDSLYYYELLDHKVAAEKLMNVNKIHKIKISEIIYIYPFFDDSLYNKYFHDNICVSSYVWSDMYKYDFFEVHSENICIKINNNDSLAEFKVVAGRKGNCFVSVKVKVEDIYIDEFMRIFRVGSPDAGRVSLKSQNKFHYLRLINYIENKLNELFNDSISNISLENSYYVIVKDLFVEDEGGRGVISGEDLLENQQLNFIFSPHISLDAITNLAPWLSISKRVKKEDIYKIDKYEGSFIVMKDNIFVPLFKENVPNYIKIEYISIAEFVFSVTSLFKNILYLIHDSERDIRCININFSNSSQYLDQQKETLLNIKNKISEIILNINSITFYILNNHIFNNVSYYKFYKIMLKKYKVLEFEVMSNMLKLLNYSSNNITSYIEYLQHKIDSIKAKKISYNDYTKELLLGAVALFSLDGMFSIFNITHHSIKQGIFSMLFSIYALVSILRLYIIIKK